MVPRTPGDRFETPTQLTHGFLPVAPLLHDGVTAVGWIDLESPAAILRPTGVETDTARDQLLLARLHGEPLATIHIDAAPGSESHEELLATIWRDGRYRLLEHINRCGCLPVPTGPDDLESIPEQSDGTCSDLQPPRPEGRAVVIICTAGTRGDLLVRALESLSKMKCADWEILVVDNRPGEGDTAEIVQRTVASVPIRYVAEPRTGLAMARNTGLAAAANAKFVAFTDDDVVADENWLTWLLAPFSRPEVKASLGLVLPLKLDTTARKRFELFAGFGKGVTPRLYDLDANQLDDQILYPYFSHFGSGNSMAFRRDALVAIGGFDTALGAGTPAAAAEETGALIDLVLAGDTLAYEPRSVIWHEHRAGEAELRSQVRNYAIGLTAMLSRYMIKDRRLITTIVARSVAIVGKLARIGNRDRDRSGDPSVTPADLARLEARAKWLGPWRYVVSRRQAAANR
jgi:O-antigen biosynthesis protein